MENGKTPDLIKIVKTLRESNKGLAEKVKKSQQEKAAYEIEKKSLIYQIDGLRKKPDAEEKLKRLVADLTGRFKETKAKFEKLVRDKNRLIHSYEQVIHETTGHKSPVVLPAQTVLEIKREIQLLKEEKGGLQNDLNQVQERFDEKLVNQIRELEFEWKQKVHSLRRAQSRLKRFSDEVMQEPESPLWMIAYADMVTLLLAFFVLYYSISAMNVNRVKDAIFGEQRRDAGILELWDRTRIEKSLQELAGLQAGDILTDITQAADRQRSMELDVTDSPIRVRIPADFLFGANRTGLDLKKEGRPALDEIISIAKRYPGYKIHIQGHTDDAPLTTERFPTNWELSASRATAVARYLVDRGIEPKRITATGYGEIMPRASNDSEIRKERNRRIEFVLEKLG